MKCYYETKNSYTIRVRSTDQGGVSTENAFTINVSKRTVDLNAKGVAQFTDADGTCVTVTLRGGGTGTIYFAHDGLCDASTIVLSGTTDKSSLTITTKGPGGGTSLGGIDTSGFPLTSIVASTTDLTGNVSVGTSTNPKATVSMTFDQIENANIDTGMPLKALTASEWLDDDGTPDVLTAPAIGAISIKGKAGNLRAGVAAVRGDFQADLKVAAPDAGVVLGTVSIAGLWDGANVTVAGCDVRTGLSITSRRAGRVGTVNMTVPGGIGSITASEWLSGVVSAGWVGSISATANRTWATSGDFGASLTLTGENVPSRTATLRTATIGGSLLPGTDWQVQSGWVTSVNVLAGMDGGSLEIAGVDSRGSSLGSLRIGYVGQASVSVLGDIGTLSTGQWGSGSVTAGWIGSLSTTANARLGLTGSFGASAARHKC